MNYTKYWINQTKLTSAHFNLKFEQYFLNVSNFKPLAKILILISQFTNVVQLNH